MGAMEENPHILEYFGLSEVFLKNQLMFMEKYEKLKGKTNDDKKKLDSEVWSKWLRQYYERVSEDFDSKSENFESKMSERVKVMNSNNPRFILRNHIVQDAIEKAEINEFTHSRMLLKVLENAFSEDPVDKILAEFDQKSS